MTHNKDLQLILHFFLREHQTVVDQYMQYHNVISKNQIGKKKKRKKSYQPTGHCVLNVNTTYFPSSHSLILIISLLT